MLKILHITNEITKKNFSITSLINYISEYGNKKNFFKSDILCSDIDLKKKNKNLYISKIRWKNFFKLRKIFLNKVKDYDVVHIHGMWAPIQLYSIILSLIYKKKTLIHPHGMLLYPAISQNGLIKKINKRFFLYILKFLFFNQKNVIFIAITKEEYSEIKNLFLNPNVRLIQNNIPFNYNKTNKKKNKLKKIFVFFGRIHPHKNIIEMINNFIDSDLIRYGWKLEIYGIPDDEIYLNQIKKTIRLYSQIKILDPVFGQEKIRIINRSWANILISKSEVLSFSILESGVHGLPSIVTNKIETLKNDTFSEKVRDKSEQIIEKLKFIADWSYKKRELIGKKTSKFFVDYKNKSDEVFIKNLKLNYEQIFYQRNYLKENNSENFYIASAVHSLNVFLPNIILLLSFFFFNSKLAAEIGLTNIVFITLTQMLSGNIRLIAIRKKSINFLQEHLFFRVIIGFLILFFYQFLSGKFGFLDDNFTNLTISTFIILLWCSELGLTIFEIKRSIGKLLIILSIYILVLIVLIISFIIRDISLMRYCILFSCLLLSIFCFRGIFYQRSKIINYKIFEYFFKDKLKYVSSLSLTLSSFCWRFYLYFTYPKEISGAIFIAFAICSFPGTFFNNVLGPNFFYNKIKINPKIKYIFVAIFIALLFYNVIDLKIYDSFIPQGQEKELFFHFLKISSLGSFLMFYAMYSRQDFVFRKKINLEILFYRDISYGLILIFILPLLDILGQIGLVSYSYLIGSIFAIIIFRMKHVKSFNYF